MSNQAGPENVAPDNQRCNALVKGTGKKRYFEWTRYDRRCSRKANQARDGVAVCYLHAQVKDFVIWQRSQSLCNKKPA